MTIYYKTVEKKLNEGRIALGLMVVLTIFLLAIIYLAQINATIAGTYQLGDYQKKLTLIQQENQHLLVALAKEQSLPFLGEKVKNMNMVAVDKIEYLNDLAGQMAVKK